MSTRPRVLLADDHAMLLEAFARMLSATCDVVGTVNDGRALIETAPILKPDIIVLDIAMPRLNGIDACRLLRPQMPDVKWVFLTVSTDPDLAREVFRLGASGFLLKSSAASELFTAIQKAMAGRRYITSLITGDMPEGVFLNQPASAHPDKLTGREREVLQLLAEGRTMKEVANVLNVTPRTVAFHKYAIMKRLAAKTGAELVQYAVTHHLVGGQGPVNSDSR
jgi:DNA-binding NarL/FixJ family response regulator